MSAPKNPAAQALARLSHRVITEKRRENARENGKKGGRPSRPMFEISILANEGEKFASVRHNASNCGADFYESGEELEWQDNNGMFSNCSPGIIAKARNAASKALA